MLVRRLVRQLEVRVHPATRQEQSMPAVLATERGAKDSPGRACIASSRAIQRMWWPQRANVLVVNSDCTSSHR